MDNKLGGLITVFIVALVGLVLIDSLGNEITKVDDLGIVTNESIDMASARAGAISNYTADVEFSLSRDDLSGFSELRMVNGTAFTKNTDYYVNLTLGKIRMLDTQVTYDYAAANESNTTLSDFTYNPDAYVKDSISRTILTSLILIFFVIGLVVWVYAYIKNNYLEF